MVKLPMGHAKAAAAHAPVVPGRFVDFADDPIEFMTSMYRQHGELVMFADDDQHVLLAFGSEYNRIILSDEDRYDSKFFVLRGPRNSAQRRLTCGLLSMNGEEHRTHRRMVKGPFEKRAIAVYHDTILRVSNELLASWKPGSVINIEQQMTELMLILNATVLFGLDERELVLEIGHMLAEWVERNQQLGTGAFIPSREFSENYDSLLSLADQLESRILEMIDRRRTNGKFGDDVLSILLRLHGETGEIDDAHLMGQVALLFGAGHLTTAHTLAWTLFLLAQHPDVMSELYQEISTIGQCPATVGQCPVFSQSDAENLSLLDRVIKESMRLLPVSAYLQRVVTSETSIGPYRLERGMPVIFGQYMTHRVSDIYQDADKFDPDRWLSVHPTPYEYLPFGAGRRMCIGAPLANLLMKNILTLALNRYQLNIVPGAEINAKVVGTILSPISGIPAMVSETDGHFHSTPVTGNIHSLVNLPSSDAEVRRAA